MIKKEITYLINGTFELIVSKQTLRNLKTRTVFKIEPLMADVLFHLINCRSRVIHRQELITKFWHSDTFGDEALTKVISKIRKELNDDCCEPKYIRTLSKVGYEWIGDVEIKPSIVKQITRRARSFQFDRRTVVVLSLVIIILFVVKSIFLPHH